MEDTKIIEKQRREDNVYIVCNGCTFLGFDTWIVKQYIIQ